jgi:hypothetical protein
VVIFSKILFFAPRKIWQLCSGTTRHQVNNNKKSVKVWQIDQEMWSDLYNHSEMLFKLFCWNIRQCFLYKHSKLQFKLCWNVRHYIPPLAMIFYICILKCSINFA